MVDDVQVGNKDVLNCYYAHAEDSLQVCHDGFLRPLLAGFNCTCRHGKRRWDSLEFGIVLG